MSMSIGVLHLVTMTFKSFYGFFIPLSPLLDSLYMLAFLLLPFSWIMMNGECFFSYLVKKHNNPHYQMGSDRRYTDMEELFPNPVLYHLFFLLTTVFFVFSVLIVNHRISFINPYLCIGLIVFYCLYIHFHPTHPLFIFLYSFLLLLALFNIRTDLKIRKKRG